MDWKQEAIDKLKGYEAQRQSMEDICHSAWAQPIPTYEPHG